MKVFCDWLAENHPDARRLEELERCAHVEPLREARRRVGELLDINAGTLRGWIERVEVDAGQRPGVPSAVEAQLKELQRENSELRRANKILRTASAFFAAAELDRRLK